MTRFLKTFALVTVVALFTSTATADLFEWDDVAVNGITYTNIFETTNTDGPLWGQPQEEAGFLDFDVIGFSANAVDGDVDFLNGMINLNASSNSGQTFNSVQLDEFGIFFNNGDTAFSSVTTFLFVTVNGQTFSEMTTQEFAGTGTGAWDFSLKVDIPDTDKAFIQIHNILLAEAGPGDVASISKRDANLRIPDGEIIPEPTSAAILFAGLMGVALRRRRS